MLDFFFTSSWLPNCYVACIWHEKGFYHLLNLWNHCCAEHVNNFLSVKLFRKYRFWTAIFHNIWNFLWEIFRYHFISLIDDNPGKSLEWEMSFLEHFFYTSRSTNNNLCTFPKTKGLELDLFTTNQSNGI